MRESSNIDWAWLWWAVIVTINFLNLVVAAIVYKRSLTPKDGRDSAYRKRMRLMGVIFTLVAAYRSVFVSRYIAQLAWFDSILNSSLLIRVFARAAELSFSGLFALATLRLNEDLPADDIDNASNFKRFILIVLATHLQYSPAIYKKSPHKHTLLVIRFSIFGFSKAQAHHLGWERGIVPRPNWVCNSSGFPPKGLESHPAPHRPRRQLAWRYGY